MKNKIFVDTSAFIAMRTQDDKNHASSIRCLKKIEDEKIFLCTTNFVLDEVYTFFCRHHDRAIEMHDLITNNAIISFHRVSAEDEAKALSILKRFPDKTFSYTDATSFAVMDRLGLKMAFSYDKHFSQYDHYSLFHKSL